MRDLRAGWQGAVLVCAKCSKKVGGGFGGKGRTPLAKALRRHLGLRRGRRAPLGVLEVKCLGVCPRGAVVVVDTNHPDRWLLVEPAADLTDLVATLTPPRAGLEGGDHARAGGAAAPTPDVLPAQA